jgi:leader peptidase (prepilin peptidase) / N-methyltransferase
LTRRDICEIAAVGILALAAAAASLAVVPGVGGVLGAGLALVMLAIAVIDARRFIIPDALTLTALALAVANAALEDWESVLEGIGAALLRGAVLALSFLAVRAVYYRIRRREGIGLGDVKLAGVAGAWLGWATIPVAVEIAALVALTIYVVRQVAGGRAVSATARMPFGLFFAPAIWIGWLLEATLLGR